MSIGFWGGGWNMTYLIWTREDQAPSTHIHGRLWKGTQIIKHAWTVLFIRALLKLSFICLYLSLAFIFYIRLLIYSNTIKHKQNLGEKKPMGTLSSCAFQRVTPFCNLPTPQWLLALLLILQGEENKPERGGEEGKNRCSGGQRIFCVSLHRLSSSVSSATSMFQMCSSGCHWTPG